MTRQSTRAGDLNKDTIDQFIASFYIDKAIIPSRGFKLGIQRRVQHERTVVDKADIPSRGFKSAGERQEYIADFKVDKAVVPSRGFKYV